MKLKVSQKPTVSSFTDLHVTICLGPKVKGLTMEKDNTYSEGGGAIVSVSDDNFLLQKERLGYDESNYPADAESEGDYGSRESGSGLSDDNHDSETDETLVHRVEERELPLSDDVLCAVCADILIEPCTLQCGHSFCQLCLAVLWKSSAKKSLCCPSCRQPSTHLPGVNIQLR